MPVDADSTPIARRLRIAMVHATFATNGGAESYVRNLSGGLSAGGHEVKVFARPSDNALDGDGALPQRLSSRLAPPSGPIAKALTHLGDVADPTVRAAVDAVRAFKPDVVHVHNWQGIGGPLVARLARLWPTVHTVHDYALCDTNNTIANRGRSRLVDVALRGRSRILLHHFRRVTFLWPAERTRGIVRDYVPQIMSQPGEIVPLAIPAEELKTVAPPGPDNIFLALGGLTKLKGIDLVLDGWASAGSPGRLLIAGTGALQADVQRAAAADPTIEYLGHVGGDRKLEAIKRSRWLVFASQCAENFSISCVESLMAGRPIIAGTISRPPMASDGSVLTFDGAQGLAQVLKGAASMSEQEYRAAADSAARDGHGLDWGEHVRRVLQVYERLTGVGGSR